MLEFLIGKRFKSLEEIEEIVFIKTGYFIKCIISESETDEDFISDNMIDYELYETLEAKNDQYIGGYDGKVYTMYYLKDNDFNFYITEV